MQQSNRVPSDLLQTPDGLNRRVLIVDDNSSIHQDFRKILARPEDDGLVDLSDLESQLFGAPEASQPDAENWFDLDSAYQGEAALERVQQALAEGRPYAVAFMDMRMPPGWDGLRTTIEILKADPQIAVVICTAYSDHSWSDLTQALGPTDRVLLLKKPFDTIEVQQFAYAMQRRWELGRQAAMQHSELASLVAHRTQDLQTANERLKAEAVQRERMEEELRLAHKLEAVGQLAAGVAHEINTPMQYIGDNIHFAREAIDDFCGLIAQYQGVMSSLGEGCPSSARSAVEKAELDADIDFLLSESPEALDHALEGVRQVSQIVQSMKEFSHPSQKQRAAASLNRALQNTLTVARNEYKNVATLETDLQTIPEVVCHIDELQQVFLNLIINAAHAIEARGEGGGTIQVSTAHEPPGHVRVEVADNGIGISEEIRHRVFDPFFTTKEVGKGTGQGLAIAHSVIDKHAGSISIESEPGVGTRFVIRLPISAVGDAKGDDGQAVS